MATTVHPPPSSRAVPSMLLEHLSRLHVGFADRTSAAQRLEWALGPELSARLLSALAGNHGRRRLL